MGFGEEKRERKKLKRKSRKNEFRSSKHASREFEKAEKGGSRRTSPSLSS